MKLVRINTGNFDAFVNVDRITAVLLNEDGSLDVQFGGDVDRDILVYPSAAEELLEWLAAEAVATFPATPEDREWRGYRDRGGILPREEWDRQRARYRNAIKQANTAMASRADQRTLDRLGTVVNELEALLLL